MEEDKKDKKEYDEKDKEKKFTDKDYVALLGSGAVLLFAIIFLLFTPRNSSTQEKTITKNSFYNDYSEYIKEKNLNIFDEVSKLYYSLVTKTYDYGFYFDKNVSIDTIESDDFLHYAIENYIVEKNIDYNTNLECITNEDYLNSNECSKKPYSVSKSVIDEYIKKNFETDREFVLTNNNEKYATRYIPINGLNQAYVYDFENSLYYFGYINRYNDTNYIYTKFLKQETDADGNIIIYNKAVVCNLSNVYDVYCLKHINDKKTSNNIVFEYSNVSDVNSIKELSFNYIDNTRFNSLNKEYVFDKYKLDTFKHTFKKINNNYYWYSTQIVNE